MLRGEKAIPPSSAHTSLSLGKNLRGALQPSDASDGPQSFERWLGGFHVPQKLIQDLLERHTVLSLAKDSRLYGRGSPADVLYWVRSGLVMVSAYFPEENDNGILVRLAGPGELIGFADFIDDRGAALPSLRGFCQNELPGRAGDPRASLQSRSSSIIGGGWSWCLRTWPRGAESRTVAGYC